MVTSSPESVLIPKMLYTILAALGYLHPLGMALRGEESQAGGNHNAELAMHFQLRFNPSI